MVIDYLEQNGIDVLKISNDDDVDDDQLIGMSQWFILTDFPYIRLSRAQCLPYGIVRDLYFDIAPTL